LNSYFEEPDEAGFRAEVLLPAPLFPAAEPFAPAALPVELWAFEADADLVSPDLFPPAVVLAIGVLAASLAPAVFFGAADFEEVLPAAAVPELFVPDPDVFDAEFFVEPAALDPPALAESAGLLEAADEEPELFAAVDLDPAADLEVEDLVREPDAALEPVTDSIAETAAPVTAPAAAPASTSPSATLVLS
jgi:hypothetical protein